MHNIRVLVLVVFIFGLIDFQMEAQQNILPSGADANGIGGSVSYSVGQLDYINFSSDSGKISLGMQQPLVVKMVATNDPKYKPGISVFPNPVKHTLNLKLEEDFPNTDKDKFSFQLYDLSGKVLVHQKVSNVSTIISMEEFGSGIYLLRVMFNRSEVRSFKIIKTN